MRTKVCKKCGTERLLDDFPKDPRNPDCHTGECKECRKVYIKAWRVAHAKPKTVRVVTPIKECIGNLQVLTETENCKKHNKLLHVTN